MQNERESALCEAELDDDDDEDEDDDAFTGACEVTPSLLALLSIEELNIAKRE